MCDLLDLAIFIDLLDLAIFYFASPALLLGCRLSDPCRVTDLLTTSPSFLYKIIIVSSMKA